MEIGADVSYSRWEWTEDLINFKKFTGEAFGVKGVDAAGNNCDGSVLFEALDNLVCSGEPKL